MSVKFLSKNKKAIGTLATQVITAIGLFFVMSEYPAEQATITKIPSSAMNYTGRGKTGSNLSHDSIRSLLKPERNIYLFYRVEDRDPFTFAGKAHAKSFENTVPVEIVWAFDQSSPQRAEVLPEEIYGKDALREGASKTITVNSYERNPLGRKICIDRFGSTCAVCNFDFRKFYGSIGEGYIHVHHLKQLSDVGEEYTLNPLTDLRPVCPNCHAMLHRRRPPYTIEELSGRIKNQ